MSTDLGHSNSYIHSIACGKALPSIRYRKILTPDQRELMEQHEEWLRESYEAEQMDRQRENWLFNRKL